MALSAEKLNLEKQKLQMHETQNIAMLALQRTQLQGELVRIIGPLYVTSS
jgi:hypothetical protein